MNSKVHYLKSLLFIVCTMNNGASENLPDEIHLKGISKKLFPVISIDAQTIMGAETLHEDEIKPDEHEELRKAQKIRHIQKTRIILHNLRDMQQPKIAATMFWYYGPDLPKGHEIYGQDIPVKKFDILRSRWDKFNTYGRNHSIVALAPIPKAKKVTEKSALAMLFDDGTVFKLGASYKIVMSDLRSIKLKFESFENRGKLVIHWPSKNQNLKPGRQTIESDADRITVISDGIKKIWSATAKFQENPLSEEETKEPIHYQTDELVLPDGTVYEQIKLPGNDHMTLRKKLQAKKSIAVPEDEEECWV